MYDKLHKPDSIFLQVVGVMEALLNAVLVDTQSLGLGVEYSLLFCRGSALLGICMPTSLKLATEWVEAESTFTPIRTSVKGEQMNKYDRMILLLSSKCYTHPSLIVCCCYRHHYLPALLVE